MADPLSTLVDRLVDAAKRGVDIKAIYLTDDEWNQLVDDLGWRGPGRDGDGLDVIGPRGIVRIQKGGPRRAGGLLCVPARGDRG